MKIFVNVSIVVFCFIKLTYLYLSFLRHLSEESEDESDPEEDDSFRRLLKRLLRVITAANSRTLLAAKLQKIAKNFPHLM